MTVTAYVWSTDKVRREVQVALFFLKQVPTNERPGSDEEWIVDLGDHVGLIVCTHWGLTPLGRCLFHVNPEEVR